MTKDVLVSAELAKEKLIHEIDILGNVYAVAKVIIMELIRNTDLTDCQPQKADGEIRPNSDLSNHPSATDSGTGLFATDADRKENDARCAEYGCGEVGQLQMKWRDPATLPEKFDIVEAEAALLDAFIRQGGAHVWRGDGSSCAAQIVQAVWNRKESK